VGAAVVVINEDKDFDQYRGKLAGKIVLLGEMREVKPVEKPLWQTLDETDLKKLTEYPLRPEDNAWQKDFVKQLELREKIGKFLGADDLRCLARLLWRAVCVGVRFCDRACRNEQAERNPLTLRRSQCAT